MKYRKKPVVIDAVQWFKHGDHPEVQQIEPLRWPWLEAEKRPTHGYIVTLESPTGHLVTPGDWIIRGVKGEHYACKPDIFALTYEPAGEREYVPRADTIKECVTALKDLADYAAKNWTDDEHDGVLLAISELERLKDAAPQVPATARSGERLDTTTPAEAASESRISNSTLTEEK